VGDVEDDSASQSGGVGVAPDECRPGSVLVSELGATSISGRGGSAGSMGSSMPSDKEEAWAEYKASEGHTIAEALTQNKTKLVQVSLPAVATGCQGLRAVAHCSCVSPSSSCHSIGVQARASITTACNACLTGCQNSSARLSSTIPHALLLQLKRTSKERAVNINAIKRKLDEQIQLAQQLQTKRLEAAGDPGSAAAAAAPEQDSSSAAVMGPEELAAVQRAQQLKAQYRDQFNELQMLKSEVAYTQQLVDQCSQQLLIGFDEW
jgi:hypothetical protein